MDEAVPLVSTPAAPVPPGAVARWVRSGRLRLRALLSPAPVSEAVPARGSVVLSPGRTEPIEKYFEVVSDLNRRGFTVLVHDWAGQGLSDRLHPDRLRGHAGSWRAYLQDYARVIAAFEAQLPRPWIAVGHSMGGGLTALALSEGERRFAAAVLSAPMAGVLTGSRSPKQLRVIARLMRLVGRGGVQPLPPVDPLRETFDANVLTHDEARWDMARAQVVAHPDLLLGGPTWAWLSFALELSARLKRRGAAEGVPIPVTVVAAGEERLVDNALARAFTARLPQGRYLEVEGAYHELLMETDARRDVFWREFDAVADVVAPRRSSTTA